MNNIIELIQEPKIAEQLELLKGRIEERTNELIKLAENACEANLQETKKARAELKKEYEELEEKRKALKNAIMQPYLAFEEKYKYIVASYKQADTVAKASIDKLETAKKKVIEEECIKYFEELKIQQNLGWLKFESIGLNITLSATLKSQKEKVLDFVCKIKDELEVIGDNAELLAEYKKCLNLAKATNIVNERQKAIESEKVEQEKRKAFKEEQARVEEKVQEALEQQQMPLSAPKVEEKQVQALKEDTKQYKVSFTVWYKSTIKSIKRIFRKRRI